MSMGQMQQRNAQNVRLLSADLQPRYEPNFAWKSACSAHLALPALRAFWPMSSVDYAAANRARDLSGQGYHLTDNNTPTFGHGRLISYVLFTAAANQYLSRADAGAANWADIRGNEGYVVGGVRGLTFGGWFRPTTAAFGYLMAKGAAAPQRAYELTLQAGGDAQFRLSVDGTATVTVNSAVMAIPDWHHIVARFEPSTSLDIFLDGVETSNVAAIPATVFDSTGPFNVGARNGASFYNGMASLCFLCAAYLSDAFVLSLFHQTRALFGV